MEETDEANEMKGGKVGKEAEAESDTAKQLIFEWTSCHHVVTMAGLELLHVPTVGKELE